MSETGGRKTAVIYSFPAGGRAGRTSDWRQDAARAPEGSGQGSPWLPTVEYGSAWYHDAAMRDAPTRGHKP